MIDKHKVIGYLYFYDKTIFITNLNLEIEYKNIKEILLCGASAEGNSFYSKSYFLIIKQDNFKPIFIHSSFEQILNGKYKKIYWWNKNKSLITILKDKQIKISYLKNINLIDK